MDYERMTAWLDRPLKKKLKARVKEDRKAEPSASASGIIRKALREYLK